MTQTFGKYLKNSSLSPRIRLSIGKVPQKGSIPLSLKNKSLLEENMTINQ